MTAVSEADPPFDRAQWEIEAWVELDEDGMEYGLKARLEYMQMEYESHLSAVRKAYG